MSAPASVTGMMEVKGLGYFVGKEHILPLRIYYEDTDLSGVVYHANYLKYMERARTEFFRLAGVTQMADLESPEPTAWAIRGVELKFMRPGRVDDTLSVRTLCTSITGARMKALQRVYCGDSLVEGRIEACIITLTGKPRRIPAHIRELLSPFLVEPVL
jgi:acyl-CoA thioester hydrolase